MSGLIVGNTILMAKTIGHELVFAALKCMILSAGLLVIQLLILNRRNIVVKYGV